MMNSLMALVVGVIFGLALSFLKLPTPAPTAFAGIAAVFGAYLGGEIYHLIQPMLHS